MNIIIITPNVLPIGHEIHISRVIIFDLLCKGLISQNDTIIAMKDRKFFYKKIFSNTLSIEEAKTKDFSHCTVLDISPYSSTLLFDTIPILKQLNYDYLNSNYKTPEFIEKCKQFNFYSIDKIKNKFGYNFIDTNKFILIHHRYGADLVHLHTIINKINEEYFIVVFNNKPEFLKNNIIRENTYFTNNLKLYASLMNLQNCVLFISEWSGGGQLAQYCYNGIILYYYLHYADPVIYNRNLFNLPLTNLDDLLQLSNTCIHKAYDCKIISNCKIIMHDNAEELANNLHKYINNHF